MINLIEEVKIYNLKFVKDYNSFLIFTKNILRILSKKGAISHNSKFVFPLRWSIKKNSFVIDFRSLKKRDIEGIDLQNLNTFYKENTLFNVLIRKILNNTNSNLEEYLEKIRFKKNESKFLAISFNGVYDENIAINSSFKFDILGIYNFTEYGKRAGVYSSIAKRSVLIENNIILLEEISKIFGEICCNKPKVYYLENYLDKYTFLKSKLDNIFNIEKNYNVSSVLLCEELCSFILESLGVKQNLICYDESILKNIIIENKLNKSVLDNKNIEEENIDYTHFLLRVF